MNRLAARGRGQRQNDRRRVCDAAGRGAWPSGGADGPDGSSRPATCPHARPIAGRQPRADRHAHRRRGRQGSRVSCWRRIAAGEIDIVVGTQAIVRSEVEFARLGLVVIDEQHKFGVRQRALLKRAGADPHCLIMTATPIPRTLTMTLYGDLDVSTLTDRPPGRQAIAHVSRRGGRSAEMVGFLPPQDSRRAAGICDRAAGRRIASKSPRRISKRRSKS